MLEGAGLSLDAKDDEGWTVLHYATFSGSRKNVEFLLEKGLDPHLPNNSGHTAYHLAAESGSGDVLKLILEREKGGISGKHVLDADGFKPAHRTYHSDSD